MPVQKELKNAYIWEYKREPTSDVLAYFPLDNNYWINSYDWQLTLYTSSSWYTFTDNSIIVPSGVYIYTGLIYNMTTYTMFWRIRNWCRLQFSTRNNPSSSSWYGRYITRNSDTNYDLYGCNWSSYTGNSYTTTAWRHSFVAACTRSASQLYIDWTSVSATNTAVNTNQQTLILRGAYNDNEASKIWISNIQWTAEQALAFHEWTKSDLL